MCSPLAATGGDGCSSSTLENEASLEARVDTSAELPNGFDPQGSAEACQPRTCTSGRGTAATRGLKRYLVYFVHRHLDFRVPELEAVAALVAGCGGVMVEPPTGNPWSPFWYAWLPSDDAARAIAARTLLVKAIIDEWAEGPDWAALEAGLRAACPARTRWLEDARTPMRVLVDAWLRRMPMAEQVACIERLGFMGFQGPFSLNNPEVTYRLVVVERAQESVPDAEPHLYFGREVATSNRRVIADYALTQVRRGSLVYDPFVGTGSLLVAAAHLDAHTLGADIDVRVLRDGRRGGDGQVLDNWSNFREYGLPAPVGLLRADAHRPPFRRGLCDVLDAVVTDPPYGVRAGARKARSRPEARIEDRATHITSLEPYTFGECVRDLLDSAARLLRPGGRLVFFMPAAGGVAADRDAPAHPALDFVGSCEQVLSTRYSRRLVTMQKVRAYDAAAAAAFHEAQGPPVSSCDELHAHVYAAANGGPTAKPKFRSKQL